MTLPTGPAVTFLFTDIEGSTRLEREVGADRWANIVAEHDRRLRGAIEAAGGHVVKTEGDAVFAAFDAPGAALEAIVAGQRSLASPPLLDDGLRVRAGLHLGVGRVRTDLAGGAPQDYVGIDVNYAARIAAAANGGQIVVSEPLVRAVEEVMASGVRLVDEGLRIVKDFDEPARLFRLVVAGVADDERPLRTLDAPSNLPHDATTLIGRGEEIERLAEAIGEHRMLTLSGPGGSGKTRLALGVADRVRQRFPHGTWFIDLASVQDPQLFESTIAATIGLRESSTTTLADALRSYLRDRHVLLILDNLEQLLPAAAPATAGLLRGAPGLRILATSRELLRIGGERGHIVPPLDIAAGVELFEDRALALRPDLVLDETTRTAIREISRRLDGLPLAIELAAARVRLLSPSLILERLANSLDLAGGSRDLPERQRTLRGAMAWSHDLLPEPERRLFRRLGVFAGGWSSDLAASVADPDGTLGADPYGALEALADKSLVRVKAAGSEGGGSGEPRFDMHPLLREYALERLEESGERADLEARHAAAMADLAESQGAQILSATGTRAIARLDLEQHNVRAALDWSIRTGQSAIGLRIMGATWRWFQQRGRVREARATLADLMATTGGDVRLRIAALAAEGGLAYWGDDFEAARRAYEERLKLADQTGDPGLQGDAHYDLGFMFMVAHDPDGVRTHEQQALDLYTEVGRADDMLRARQALVLAVFLGGDNALALELEGENLAAFRKAGSAYQIADSMTFHAGVYFKTGDDRTAWQFMSDGLRWFAESDNQSGIARALGMAAIISLTRGDAELGARAAGATYEIVREKGVMLAPVKVLHLREPREIAIERLGEARAEELMAEGAAMPVADVIQLVLEAPARASEGT